MIGDGRSAATLALCAGALLAAALAPSAGASLQPSLDAGGLVLTDVTGSADDVTLSTNKTGLFIAVADKANTLEPVCPLGSAMSFVAILATAPPKGSAKKGKGIATATAAGHRPREAALQARQAQHRLPEPPPRGPCPDRCRRHHGRRAALPAQPALRLAGTSSSDSAPRQPAAAEDPRQAAPPARR